MTTGAAAGPSPAVPGAARGGRQGHARQAPSDSRTPEQRLAEAGEQLAAMSEILRVISRSPSNAQPVFDTIVTAALKLCDATASNVVTFDGRLIHVAAVASKDGHSAAALRRHFDTYPRLPSRDTANTRAILTCSVVSIADVLADPDYAAGATAIAAGYRSVLSVPLLRDRRPIGAITVARREPGQWPAEQVALLQTFAEQAVIAIENVRLVRELEERNLDLAEALQQQTATSEILRVIARSPTDVQPVFDRIADTALRLCSAMSANVFTFDGRLLHAVAIRIVEPGGAEAVGQIFPRPPDRCSAASRAVLERCPVAIHDVLDYPEYALKDAPRWGFRSVLAIPLLRDGAPIGAIAVGRSEPGPFPERQIALLRTFADQALIAIENTRLFNELEARNRALTGALEQQTATADILRVISSSPTDALPVFETIARNAVALCGSLFAKVLRFDGERLHHVTSHSAGANYNEVLKSKYPMLPDRSQVSGRVILSGSVITLEDAQADAEYDQALAVTLGWRRLLGVPMLRDGRPIGVIAVGWDEPGPTPKGQETLLKTFADQAVIAVENTRLFGELESRTAQLTRSVAQLRALAEVGQAVSSTLDLETVLTTIVARATQLAGMEGGAIYEFDETRGEFRLHATDGLPAELSDALRATPMPKSEGAIGRLAMTREAVVIEDIGDASRYRSRVRGILVRHGYRSLLALPLLRENRLLGGLVVNRKRAGEFEPEVVELLQTFAAQSALAIGNARLFREIEDKSRELEIASRHKSAFLANMSHELRTPLNAIIGFTRIVMRRAKGEIEAKQYENLEKILASGQHLLSLINAILDLAKIEAGRVELNAGDIRLPPLLAQCARTIEPLVRESVTLRTSVPDDMPPLVADEEKLRQIVVNLLANAAKFTAQGSIEVRARAIDGVVEIAVADTGVGIAEDKLGVIFEEFEQADAGSTRVYGGTGLGLAIARRLARLMGGEIRVESRLGAGSTFTVSLPATAVRG